MVLLNEGLNKLATELSTDITKGQWGTGTNDPTVSDTGLQSPLASTLLTVTATTSGNTAQFNHTVGSTVANGETLTEFELQFADGTSLNRTLGGGIAKTASFDIETISTISFIRG